MHFMIPATDPRYLEIYNKDGELIDIITNLIKKNMFGVAS